MKAACEVKLSMLICCKSGLKKDEWFESRRMDVLDANLRLFIRGRLCKLREGSEMFMGESLRCVEGGICGTKLIREGNPIR